MKKLLFLTYLLIAFINTLQNAHGHSKASVTKKLF